MNNLEFNFYADGDSLAAAKAAGVPVIVADGMGVDSTAMLILLRDMGIVPDLILHALTGSEKRATERYYETRAKWLEENGFPAVTFVRYEAKNLKHFPHYGSLYENCLTNGTLPSLAFGGLKSCSKKWKISPMNSWIKGTVKPGKRRGSLGEEHKTPAADWKTSPWPPALAAWAKGTRCVKLIGFDAAPADTKRLGKFEHKKVAGTLAGDEKDDLRRFENRYPLVEAGITRKECLEIIAAEGLPAPPKSACIFCPAMKPHELNDLEPDELRKIVVLEARAFPRLKGYWSEEELAADHEKALAKWEAESRKGKPPRPLKPGEGCMGLWNHGAKSGPNARPPLMTEEIRNRGLLPSDEIDSLWSEIPKAMMTRLEDFREMMTAGGMTRNEAEGEIDNWRDYLAKTFEKYGTERNPCEGCPMAA